MRLGKVECEILTFLYERYKAYRGGQVKTPIVAGSLMKKALVEDYCGRFELAARLEPLLFTRMYQNRARSVKRGVAKLERAGLIRYAVEEGGVRGYMLSEEGRRVASQLIKEGALEKSEMDRRLKMRERLVDRESEVKDALKSLWEKGFYAASLDEIYEELWENGGWGSREEFEAYWTKAKLAKTLRQLNIKSVRKWNSGKIKILYILPAP